jgi:primosomal protein N' (replication factor Y) (superfamily II helicase)
MTAVNILLTNPLPQVLSWTLPEGVEHLPLGTIVTVPFRRQVAVGVVWDYPTIPPTVPLKSILDKVDLPPIPEVLLEFIKRVARYMLTPEALILKLVFGGKPMIERTKYQVPAPLQLLANTMRFQEGQLRAVNELLRVTEYGKFQAMLLDGVTGAGKTAVFLEGAASVLAAGKQVCILVPEIALTQGMLERFQERFGVPPLLWHSGLSPTKRKNTWQMVLKGEAQMIVGARSALFLPFPNLGLIVVDEEHDPTYKQEDNVRYHARDMAVLRAKMTDIPIVLVSATPSLETLHNVQTNKYKEIRLTDRIGDAGMPDIHLVDLRAAPLPKGQALSHPLKQAMEQALTRNEQILLFVNRRGFAPLTICGKCGHRWQCPSCTAWV